MCGEDFAMYQKKVEECVQVAKLIYKQIKPKPIKLKKSIFAAELEEDF